MVSLEMLQGKVTSRSKTLPCSVAQPLSRHQFLMRAEIELVFRAERLPHQGNNLAVLQKQFCNVFTMSEEGKGIAKDPGGRPWGRCFHNDQPHWLNLSFSLGKITL